MARYEVLVPLIGIIKTRIKQVDLNELSAAASGTVVDEWRPDRGDRGGRATQ